MELLLIRHGEAVTILDDGRITAADPPLSDLGRSQADRLADWYRHEGIDAIVSSPMRRAMQTAIPLAAACGLSVVADEELAEYDRNATSYIPPHLVGADDPEYRAMVDTGTYLRTETSEAPEAFQRRSIAAVERVIAAHPGQTVAVVCHGGVINVYLGHVLQHPRMLWFVPENTSVSRVAAARSGQRSIVSVGEAGHLVGRRDESIGPAEPPHGAPAAVHDKG